MNKITYYTLAVSMTLAACSGRPERPDVKVSSGLPIGANSDPRVVEMGVVPTVEALELKPLSAEIMFPILSHSQFENALRITFNLDSTESVVSSSLPAFASQTFFDNDSQGMIINYGMLEAYAQVSTSVVEKLVAKSTLYQKAIPTNAPAGNTIERAKAIVAAVLKRAYRGSETADEIQKLGELYASALKSYPTDGFDKAGMRALIPAIIFSPKFIYSSQVGKAASGGAAILEAKELTARLAATLWNAIPDDKLLTQAATLKTEETKSLSTLVESMASDARFDKQITRFNLYALQQDYTHLIPHDDAIWTDSKKEMIRKETEAFFDYIAKNNKGLNEILTAPYAFVSDASAKYYGVTSPGAVPKKTDLDPKQRRGIFSQIGFLAYYADDGVKTIRRGASISKSLVCSAALNGERMDPTPVKAESKITNRQAVSKATDGCGLSCHKPLMNPIGFAFEKFGTNGETREMDNGFAIDAADVLYLSEKRSIEYDGAPEFAEKLAGMLESHRCYASKVVQYVFGRNPSVSETGLIDELAFASLEGASTKDLFKKAVLSPSYKLRAGK